MKRILILMACAIMIFALCSCGSKETKGSYKEVEDYKKASSDGYAIKYDDKTFSFVKADGFDYLILKSKQKTSPDDYAITITKIEKKTPEEYAKDVEKRLEEKGCSEISTEASASFGENALCVSALADEGETVYESELVAFDGGVYDLSYHYSTSLEDVAVADTIYSIISSFEIK